MKSRFFRVVGLYTVFVVGLFFVLTQNAFAQSADLSLSPSSGTFEVGKTFSVKVLVDSGDVSVNTGEAQIKFNPAFVNVDSISKAGSVLSLWSTEPAFSNTKGTIDFAGGSNSGVFSGQKTFLTIVFKAKKEGEIKIDIVSGQVIAVPAFADILDGKLGGVYTIGPGTVVEVPPKIEPKPTPIPTGPKPTAPEITSSSGDPDSWTNDPDVTFSWELSYGVTSVYLLFDEMLASLPTIDKGLISERTLTLDEDGEWYFHIAFRNATGLGDATHFGVKVDTEPPGEFTLTALGRDLETELAFTVEDTLSGIDHYEIIIDGGSPLLVTPDKVIDGKYILTVDPGEHTVTVEAYDLAGNMTSSETTVTVTGVKAPPKVASGSPVEDLEEEEGVDWMYFFSLLLVALVAFLTAYIYFLKKSFAKERDQIKIESNEILEKTQLIFASLSNEVEDQVTALANKPILTEVETETMDKLKEALELSEELIDKEIEDVRKLVN